MKAFLTSGAEWIKTASTIYRLDIDTRMMCWLYCPKPTTKFWYISYSGPSEPEQFPNSTFASIQEAMQYAETVMIFKNT